MFQRRRLIIGSGAIAVFTAAKKPAIAPPKNPGRIRLSKKNIKMIQTNELGIRDGCKLNPIITGDKGFPSIPW